MKIVTSMGVDSMGVYKKTVYQLKMKEINLDTTEYTQIFYFSWSYHIVWHININVAVDKPRQTIGKGGQGLPTAWQNRRSGQRKRRKSADLQGFFLLKRKHFHQTGSFSALLWFWVARSGTDTYVYFSACQSTQNIGHCCPSPGLTWGCIDDHLLSTRESIPSPLGESSSY